jgi:hypothetical protein
MLANMDIFGSLANLLKGRDERILALLIMLITIAISLISAGGDCWQGGWYEYTN